MPNACTEPELMELLKKLANEALGIDLGDAAQDSQLDSLGLDSFARLELITSVEAELSIRIPDERVSELEKVGDLVQCLLDLQGQAPDPANGSDRGNAR